MLQGYVKSQNIIFKNLFLVKLHMRHDRYGDNYLQNLMLMELRICVLMDSRISILLN